MRRRGAVSSNIFTGAVVGGFVAVVIIALVWTSFAQAPQQETQLSFQELTLFGGAASNHSFTNSCNGASELQMYAQNPTPAPISILGVTIYGDGVENATVYISLSNACLTISEAGVSVPAGGDYQLVGYVNEPLAFTSTYRCIVTFSNGQVLNQTLIAQS
jgi:hypothetical protein